MTINEKIAKAVTKHVMEHDRCPVRLFLGAEEWAELDAHVKAVIPGYDGLPSYNVLLEHPNAIMQYAGLNLEQVARQSYLAVTT